MASPVVENFSETSIATDATGWTINRPAGVSGRLTIACAVQDGTTTFTWPGDYTEFVTQNNTSNQFFLRCAYHQEDGSEGTTFAVTVGAIEKGAAVVYQISGAENPSTTLPDATGNTNIAATTTPTSPSHTPAGGSKDYLWLTVIGIAGEEADDDTWGGAAPTNYSNAHYTTSGTGGTAATNCSLCTAQRALTAVSEDPGNWGAMAQSLGYSSATIAIHPGAPAVPASDPGFERNATKLYMPLRDTDPWSVTGWQ